MAHPAPPDETGEGNAVQVSSTHLLEGGGDIRTVQELLGHRDVRTTMVYPHVLNRGPAGGQSPLDRLGGSAGRRRRPGPAGPGVW